MKRICTVLAVAAFAAAVPAAYAQGMQYNAPQERKVEAPKQEAGNPAPTATQTFNVEQPKPKCEDAGAYPGRVGMQTEDRRNRFLKGIETYKTCMLNFVEERKAVIKANETAARAAIDEFNARMKKYAEEQEKSKE